MTEEQERLTEVALLQGMVLAAEQAAESLEEMVDTFVRVGQAIRELIAAMPRNEVRSLMGYPHQVISTNRGTAAYIPLGRRM